MQVRFGNTAPVQVTRDADDQLERTAIEHADADAGESVTEMEVPDDLTLGEAFVAVTAGGGAWDYHSDEAPAWVSATGPDAAKAKQFADLLGAHFGCDVRKHDTKVVTVFGDPSVAKPAAHRAALAHHAARVGVKGGQVDEADEEAGA